MTKFNRVVLSDGDYHEVSCAVLADGSAPVPTLLAELKQGVWPDPHVDPGDFPDSYQSSIRRRFLASAEHLACYGELESAEYNHLEEGVWEFKVSNLRVTFFDTPGDGTFTPKFGTPHDTWDGRYRPKLPEDFDEFIRVGHYFGKNSQAAPPLDVARSLAVREEDLSHD